MREDCGKRVSKRLYFKDYRRFYSPKGWIENPYFTRRFYGIVREKRSYDACEDKSLVRPARRPNTLAEPWDDYQVRRQKSWKYKTLRPRQHRRDQRLLHEMRRQIDPDWLQADPEID